MKITTSKDLWPDSLQPGYFDYLITILNNGVSLEMEMATKNYHQLLSFTMPNILIDKAAVRK